MMIIALGASFASFVLVEAIYLNTIYNLETGFLPALGVALISFMRTSIWLANVDTRRDFPEPTYWRLPTPQVISIAKRVLKTYSYGRSRWFITYEDRQAGEIHATLSFTDDSYSDMRWLVPTGRIEKSITVRISFEPKPDSATEVVLTWLVDSPISRFDCNCIIAEVTNSITQDLADAQYSRLTGLTK
ncbi:MAG: hypothetical protein SFY67_12015 [Candidatus Melainabacteria bacterium]|nr:hypothetical protein [Candidatus Melainabacteria bacterium]